MSLKDNVLLDVVIKVLKRSNDLDVILSGLYLEQRREFEIKKEEKDQIEAYDRAKQTVN